MILHISNFVKAGSFNIQLVQINTQVTDTGFCIALQGALDASTSQLFANEVKSALLLNTGDILIDFAGVTQVAPSALRNLLPLVEQMQKQKKEFVLFNLRIEIQNMLQSSGFDSLVKVYLTRQAAIEYINSKNKNKTK